LRGSVPQNGILPGRISKINSRHWVINGKRPGNMPLVAMLAGRFVGWALPTQHSEVSKMPKVPKFRNLRIQGFRNLGIQKMGIS
jgi:hypothetical protein